MGKRQKQLVLQQGQNDPPVADHPEIIRSRDLFKNTMKQKNLTAKDRTKLRVRKKILNRIDLPRLTVFRSNKKIYAQIIDDKNKKTLVAVHENELVNKDKKIIKMQKAKELGVLIAHKALRKKLIQVVYDRGSHRYHGRVKALADGAREGGLQI